MVTVLWDGLDFSRRGAKLGGLRTVIEMDMPELKYIALGSTGCSVRTISKGQEMLGRLIDLKIVFSIEKIFTV
jgi:hypothetical protein